MENMSDGLNYLIAQGGGGNFDFGKSFVDAYSEGQKQRKAEIETQNALAKKAMLSQLYANTPRDQLGGKLVQSGMLEEAKQLADVDKTQAETQDKQFNNKRAMIQAGADMLGQVLADSNSANKASIAQHYQAAVQNGILSPEMAQQSMKEVQGLPDDPAAIQQWAKGKLFGLQDAAKQMGFLQPDANARLSAETTRRGQDITQQNNLMDNQYNMARFGYDQQQDAANQAWNEQKFNAEQDYKNNMLTGRAGANGRLPGAPTEDERKAAGWLAQADNAYKNMLAVTKDSPESANPGILETIAPNSIKGAFQDAKRQQYVQAASSFAEAALRAATGAGITKDEAEQKIRELTPEYLDKPELKKQKMDSLKVYLDSLKTRASRAAPEGYQVPTGGGASDSWGNPAPPGVDPNEWAQFLQETGGQ